MYKTSRFFFLMMDPSRVCHLSKINGSVWKPSRMVAIQKHLSQRTKQYSQLLFLLQNKLGFSGLRHSVSERFCTNNRRRQETPLQPSQASSSHFERDVIEACCNGEIRASPRAHKFFGIRPSRKYAVVTRLPPPPAHLINSAERARERG